MKLTFLAVGKRHDPAIAEAINDYSARLQKYCHPNWVIVPSPKASLSPAEQKRIETSALLAKIPPGAAVVLLDEHGSQVTTREFTSKLAALQARHKEIVFVIGGAFGVSDEIRRKATGVTALSLLTFPHQLVRLIIAEQTYRALTLLQNEPYHHD